MKKKILVLIFLISFLTIFPRVLAFDWQETCPSATPICICAWEGLCGPCESSSDCIVPSCSVSCPSRPNATSSSTCSATVASSSGCNPCIYSYSCGGYYTCSGGSCTATCNPPTGNCQYTCNSGWYNDDGVNTNGCENAAPQWFTPSENSTVTIPGQVVEFRVNWTDNTGEASKGFGVNYTWFSWNASGASCNEWANISYTAQANVQSTWFNTTQIIPSACSGKTIAWKQYANDSANRTNVSQERYLYPDTSPPTYSSNSTNSTSAGTPVEFRLKWNDNIGLSGYIFSFDNCTGSFVNDSFVNFLSKKGPSTVGTSTTSSALFSPSKRKTFYANGRFWVFYINGSNNVYKTSTDGITWSNEVIWVNGTDWWHIAYDGTYLYYFLLNTSGYPTNVVRFRRGTPNSDGSITWSADEQTVTSGSYLWEASGEPDTNGYPYAGSELLDFKIYKSSTNDGTWSTASGYPISWSTGFSDDGKIIFLRLLNGKMYAIGFGTTGTTVKVGAKYYNGTSWLEDEYASTSYYQGERVSAVAIGDEVHVVFLNTNNNIVYVRRTAGTGSWSSEEIVQSGVTSTSAPVLTADPATGNLYVFWAGSPLTNHIYYKRRVGGTWDASPILFVNESTEGLTTNDNLASFYQAYDNKIGLVYMTGTGSPYQIKFGFLDLAPSSDWSNVTKIINTTVGCKIRWKQYANDTSNNWNESEIFSFTTTIPPSPCNIKGYVFYYNTGFLVQTGTVSYIIKEIGDRSSTQFSNGYFELNCYLPEADKRLTIGMIVNTNDKKMGYYQFVKSGIPYTQTQQCSANQWHFNGKAIDSETGQLIESGRISVNVIGRKETNSTTFSNGEWDIFISPCLISGEVYTFQFIVESGNKRSYMFLNQVAK